MDKQDAENETKVAPAENGVDGEGESKAPEEAKKTTNDQPPATPGEKKEDPSSSAGEAAPLPQKGEEPVPAPVTANDINQGSDAPPDYEQIMGQHLTTIIFAQPELPPLSYIDIMPRVLDPGNIRYQKAPTFERFR